MTQKIDFNSMSQRWVPVAEVEPTEFTNVCGCQDTGEIFAAPVTGILADLPQSLLRGLAERAAAILQMDAGTMASVVAQMGLTMGAEWLMNAAAYELRPACGCASKVQIDAA